MKMRFGPAGIQRDGLAETFFRVDGSNGLPSKREPIASSAAAESGSNRNACRKQSIASSIRHPAARQRPSSNSAFVILRIERQNGPQMFDGFFMPPVLPQHAADLQMGARVRRVQIERLLIARHGFVDSPCIEQCIGQMQMMIGDRLGDARRAAETADGQFAPMRFSRHDAQPAKSL